MKYVATSHPDNKTCMTAKTKCTISGLSNGASYTFTVVAKNRAGAGPSSKSSNKVTPTNSSTLSFTDESGNPYNVAVFPLIDPAKGAQDATPNAGDRFVAVLFKITDTGKNQISDDANINASIIGSNDETYTNDFDDVTECTNFNGGDYALDPKQSALGCVVFQLPNAVNVKRVEWAPNGGFGGRFGEWNA